MTMFLIYFVSCAITAPFVTWMFFYGARQEKFLNSNSE